MKETTLKIVCAWCGKDMGEKDGQGVEGISHGICPDCADGLRPKPCHIKGSGRRLCEPDCQYYPICRRVEETIQLAQKIELKGREL